MKQYSHNYTKPSKVESLLYSAMRLMGGDRHQEALEELNKARQILSEYLAQDNMVEDNDTVGWIRSQEIFDDDQMEYIRDVFADSLDEFKGRKPDTDATIRKAVDALNKEKLDIINICQKHLGCPKFGSVKAFWNAKPEMWIRKEE